MNTKHELPRKSRPKRFGLGIIVIVVALAIISFKIVPSLFRVNDQLAYLAIVNGEVRVSDGISEVAAVTGALIPGNVRTLLKTGRGNASLNMPDGSLVIMDSSSTIEFNRQNGESPGKSFIFNLVKGRVLVINEKDSQAPTQLLIGGNIAVRVFQSTMGLEVFVDGEVRQRVDCLFGQCLVNGVSPLVSGQCAQIGAESTIQVTDGVGYDTWVNLVRTSQPNSTLSNLFTSIIPTITFTNLPTALLEETTPASQITDNITLTPSPSFTITVQLTATYPPTSTIIPFTPTVSRPTLVPKRTLLPTATLKPVSSPVRSKTSSPSKTPKPNTPIPTSSKPPQPSATNTQLPTPAPQMTATLTDIPVPTDAPIPTEPILPTDAQNPTAEITSEEVIAPTDGAFPPLLP